MESPDTQTQTITTDTTWSGHTQFAVTVATGATLAISGTHEGSVTIDSLGTVIVTGDIVGPIEIRVAGTLVIEEGGRVAGSISNFGSVTNRGLRAGRVDGREPDDQDGSETVDVSAGLDAPSYRLPPRD